MSAATLIRMPSLLRHITLLGLLSSAVWGADEAWQDLVKNSPFGTTTGATAAAPAAWEFRGFVQEGDVQFFNLYDTAAKTSRWLAVEHESGGLRIEGYNAETKQLTLRQGERRLSLPLKQAQVALAAAPSPSAKPAGEVANAGPVIAPEEKANLQKIAEEIRRRRALRAQTETSTPPPKSETED